MALYLGENVVQDSQHRMDWTALEENFGEFVPLWHLMVRDANATERIVPSGIELDYGHMQLEVCVVIFVTDKLRKPKSRRMESGSRAAWMVVEQNSPSSAVGVPRGTEYVTEISGSQHIWELAKLRGEKAIMNVLDDSLVEEDIESIWKGSTIWSLKAAFCIYPLLI